MLMKGPKGFPQEIFLVGVADHKQKEKISLFPPVFQSLKIVWEESMVLRGELLQKVSLLRIRFVPS